MALYIIYMTCRDNREAKKIAKHLLSKRLIACANIFPAESIYRWEGNVVEENEAVLIAKTTADFEIIKTEVEKIHSYEIPCIIRISAEANEEFENWATNETKG
ncbi:MAG: hypothetical protein MSIBF_00470 [Candidatus Altiarchaeales archaeon IMC4]|nr:MAG: hypothetical protein MSIBF_00470 [Candidatus Altiarchaeales archaeon IMC4]